MGLKRGLNMRINLIKIIVVLVFIIFKASTGFTLKIECSIPQVPTASYVAGTPVKTLSINLDKILNLVFSNETYTMDFVPQGSFYTIRVFYNFDSSRIVETGFPDYVGIRYKESGTIGTDYFLHKINEYFGNFLSNIQLPYDIVTNTDKKIIYRFIKSTRLYRGD